MELDQGGAWCGTTGKESCSIRKMTEYGSSKFMKPIAFDGVLSDQQPQNPGMCVAVQVLLSLFSFQKFSSFKELY